MGPRMSNQNVEPTGGSLRWLTLDVSATEAYVG